MATIEVEGRAYKVTENLGFQGGYNAKAVETEAGERIAVKRGGRWGWWRVSDRVRPARKITGQRLAVQEGDG